MLKRVLAIAVAALVAPVPTVWLFVKYGEWLYARFLDIGLPDDGAQFVTGFVIVIFAMGSLMVLVGKAVLKADKIGHWIKTGKFHA